MDLVFAYLAVLQFADHGRSAQRHLVHAVLAIDHQGVVGAEALQHAHLDADQVGMEHAHQLVRRAGRIGQRTEDVEDGAHAQFLADRSDVLHRAVMTGREHEADAHFLDACGDPFGRKHHVRTERFEHVGAAGPRRHAAVAVLGDARARGCRDEHRGGRDVERVRRIAPRAAQVDQMRLVGNEHRRRELTHHLRRGGDLAHRFLLDAQAGQNRGRHHRRHLATHDEPHDLEHLVVKDLAMLDGSLQRFGGGDGHDGPSTKSKRL